MAIFNCPGEVSTFENTRGHCSNIDVTLGSGSLEQRWKVHKEWSLSDHRLKTYDLNITIEQIRCPRDLRHKVTTSDLD